MAGYPSSSFGGAEQADRPPDEREPVPDHSAIRFGERLRATFHLVIGDTRYVTVVEGGTTPPTAPNIGGTLDGCSTSICSRPLGEALPAADMGDRDRREVTVDRRAGHGGGAIGRQRDPPAPRARATAVPPCPAGRAGERVRARIEREKGRRPGASRRRSNAGAPTGGAALSAVGRAGLPVEARHDRRRVGGKEGDRRARAGDRHPAVRAAGPESVTATVPSSRWARRGRWGSTSVTRDRRSGSRRAVRCPAPSRRARAGAARARPRDRTGDRAEVQVGPRGSHPNVVRADAPARRRPAARSTA